MSAPHGPFGSEREARAAAHRVVSPEPGWCILRRDGNRELLRLALDEAGVATSAYEERIASWLAGWEDSIVAVIAGWVARANSADVRDAAPVLDSEAWTCRECGGQFIGQRTPDDLCAPCLGFRLAAPANQGDAGEHLDDVCEEQS